MGLGGVQPGQRLARVDRVARLGQPLDEDATVGGDHRLLAAAALDHADGAAGRMTEPSSTSTGTNWPATGATTTRQAGAASGVTRLWAAISAWAAGRSSGVLRASSSTPGQRAPDEAGEGAAGGELDDGVDAELAEGLHAQVPAHRAPRPGRTAGASSSGPEETTAPSELESTSVCGSRTGTPTV